VIQTTLKNKQCAVSPDGSLEGHLAWLRGMHGAVLKSKAWLWQYGAEGMEKEDYTEAMANIEAIVQSSQSLWADPAPLTLPPFTFTPPHRKRPPQRTTWIQLCISHVPQRRLQPSSCNTARGAMGLLKFVRDAEP